MSRAEGPQASGTGGVHILPLRGIPEVRAGDDLAGLLLRALAEAGTRPRAGDCLVVSSKVVSKARGLTWDGERAAAVAAQTRRVVAERAGGLGVTRVVEAVAGPVMAAAGVDASNTGPAGLVLLLPEDPDAEAALLRSALLAGAGLPADTGLGVVLSDTAGRPWRAGLTDLAIGAAGIVVLDDLRGGADHDGRPLVVTERAVADELAAAADLVKGKADGVPAALVRGLPTAWFASPGGGARTLVRTGPGDWFGTGPVEALRAALGVEPGSAASEAVGIRSVGPQGLAERVGRVVALALREVPDGSCDVALEAGAGPAVVLEAGAGPSGDAGAGPSGDAGAAQPPGRGESAVGARGGEAAVLVVAAPDAYDVGRLVVRVQVAAASEDLQATVTGRSPTSATLRLT